MGFWNPGHPNIRGRLIPSRCISLATCTISSNDGVIKPLSPMISTFLSWDFKNFSHREIHDPDQRPQVIALQHYANDVFPDVVQTPFTVTIQYLAFTFDLVPFFGLDKRNKVSNGLLSLFTAGQNIYPPPNKSPTVFISIHKRSLNVMGPWHSV